MKIVITGVRGFIGSHLARYLHHKGHDIVGLGRDYRGSGFVRLDIDTHEVINEQKSLDDYMSGAEAVIHLAARQLDHPDTPLVEYLPSNIVLTEQVCRSSDPATLKKLVFASTRLVYPGDSSDNVPESCPADPDTLYGLSKKMGEQITGFYARSKKWTGISLRLGQVFGAEPDGRGAIARFIQQARNNSMLTVYGEGVAVRDFIYIKDVLTAFENALISNVPSGAYNIGSGCGYSIKELATSVSEVFLGGEDTIQHITASKEDLSRYVMDCSKAMKFLKWKPQWSLQAALQDIRTTMDTQ